MSPKLKSSKLYVELPKKVSAGEAFLHLSTSLVKKIEEKLQQIKESPDIEVLHDLRVETRRLRTLLGKCDDLLKEDFAEKISELPAKIAKATNIVRDLDVFLASRDEYKSSLQVGLHKAFDELFVQIKSERDKEFNQMINNLNQIAPSVLAELKQLLSPGVVEFTKNAHDKAKKIARKAIKEKFKRLRKMSKKINKRFDDESLHKIRIACKHMRYLIELFSSLFKKKKVRAVLKKLKKLQDKLGAYNDLRCQINYLLKMKETPEGNTDEKRRVLKMLVETLEKEKTELRKAALKELEVFISSTEDAIT